MARVTRLFGSQNTVQFMTASMVRVSNLTPGSDNPTGEMMEGGNGVMFTPVPPWNFSSRDKISPLATTVRLGSSATTRPFGPTTPTVTSTQREGGEPSHGDGDGNDGDSAADDASSSKNNPSAPDPSRRIETVPVAMKGSTKNASGVGRGSSTTPPAPAGASGRSPGFSRYLRVGLALPGTDWLHGPY